MKEPFIYFNIFQIAKKFFQYLFVWKYVYSFFWGGTILADHRLAIIFVPHFLDDVLFSFGFHPLKC